MLKIKQTLKKIGEFLVALSITAVGLVSLASLSSIIDHALEMIWRLF